MFENAYGSQAGIYKQMKQSWHKVTERWGTESN